MKLTALELVRIIVALNDYEEVDPVWIEELQTKVVDQCVIETVEDNDARK